jgi:hypothetical protein
MALTNVTDAGIAELKRALPKLKTDQGPPPAAVAASTSALTISPTATERPVNGAA